MKTEDIRNENCNNNNDDRNKMSTNKKVKIMTLIYLSHT